jgi:hypothetical protein
MQNILLIDDIESQIDGLHEALSRTLADGEAELRKWIPSKDDQNPQERFEKLVDDDTGLVITDYDLTSKGQTGLFGSTIVGWCQSRVIPVGDFSRANRSALPREPNQYEIRIPTDPERAARYIAGVFRGFREIRTALHSNQEALKTKRSPVSVLAEILGRPVEESRFALYGGGLGTSNAALMDQILGVGAESEPTDDQKRKLLTYVIGHLLLNVILRFPGPLLHRKALAAYVAISENESDKIEQLFTNARYKGPFSDIEPFYWLSDVDNALDEMARGLPSETSSQTQGQLNREALEKKLGQQLARHKCPRCDGVNGGFWCPFTQRTVCVLAICSVGSTGWIPQGARLCRIEKDFYDEWAPMLGF